MKKSKWLIIALIAAMSLTACSGSKKPEDGSEISTSETLAEGHYAYDSTDIPVSEGEVALKDCITIPEWKGMKLTKSVTVVSDEEVESYATDFVAEPVEIDKNTPMEAGFTANIDYKGTIDGKEFDGGSAEGTDVTIGNYLMLKELEDGLIGMKVGEEKDIEATFPEDYGVEELNGKKAVFHVKLNSATKNGTPTQENLDYARKTLEDYQEYTAQENLENAAWKNITDRTSFTEIPMSLVNAAGKEYDQVIINNYGGKDQYIKDNEMSEEDYAKERDSVAKDGGKYYALIDALAEEMGIEEGSEDYNKELETLVSTYGVSEEEFMKTNGETPVKYYIKYRLVLNKILEAAEITEEKVGEETGAPAAETSAASETTATAETTAANQ